MKKFLMRGLSVLLCMVLITSGMPVFAEDDMDIVIADIIPAEQPPAPDEAPTEAPVLPPVPEITLEPTQLPTEVPAEVPAATPEVQPTQEATTEPTIEATAEPTAEPSFEPTTQPSAEPTVEPPAEPTLEATAEPTAEPSAEPTLTPEELAAQQELQLAEVTSLWLAAMNEANCASDFERAFWFYAALLSNVTPGSADTAYAALVEGSAGSLGYARALEKLLTAAGIECITVSSANDSAIAWNVAKLDGAWTHIDAAMDDASEKFGMHFGLTDSAMALDHVWNSEIPACTSAQNNYFVRAEGYLGVESREVLASILTQAAEAKAEELKIYNAAGLDLDSAVSEILFEIAPAARAFVETNHCLATIRIAYDAPMMMMMAAPRAVAPEQIVPASPSIVLGVQESSSIANWTLLPEGTQDEITYSSKSPSIASVNAEGIVTGKKAGKTTVTITASTGASCEVAVEVKKAPTSVSITGGRTPLGVGEELQLGYKLSSGSAGAVTFRSADESIAIVTPDGYLVPIAPGKVTITAETYNKKKKTATLEVKPAPASIALEFDYQVLGVGDSKVLSYTLNEGCAGAVTYTSSNEAVATVDQKGKIVAVSELPANPGSDGTVEIIATTYNGISASCKLKVVPAPTGLKLEIAPPLFAAKRTTDYNIIGVKEQVQLTPVFEPDTALGTIKYKSSNTSVASVNASGLVTGKKTGSATITATAYNNVKATIKITVRKAPAGVKITGTRTPVGVGETIQLDHYLSSGSAGAVSYSLSNTDVLHFSTENSLYAAAEGLSTLTATTYNGKKHSVDIEIKPAPAAVIPSAESITIGAKDIYTLGYTLNEGAAGAVTFSSGDESIAVVDQAGKITALQPGTVDITITAYNGANGVCKVTVVPEPAGITLSAPRTSIGLKEQVQITPILDPAETAGTVKYKSSKSSIASVDANGLVTGKKAGTVTITATTYNNKKATIKITVRKAPSGVKITGVRNPLGVGEAIQLNYTLSSGSSGAVAFTSSNNDVLFANPDGSLIALAEGTATLTATTYNGKKHSVDIGVKPAPAAVIPSAASITIGAKDSHTLGYTLNEGAAGAVTFSSGNESIAVVDQAGKITALQPGTADITITAYNGANGVCKVTVVPEPAGITLSAPRTSIGLKEQVQITPILDPAETAGTVKYKSSKSSIASVDANGLVTGKKAGTVTITATTYNNKKATIKITVRKAPSGVKIAADRSILCAGEAAQLKYTLSSGASGGVTFSGNNDAVALVTPDGLLASVAPGTVTVTATTYNGKSASMDFTINPAPTAVMLTETEKRICAGDSFQLNPSVDTSPVCSYTYTADNACVEVSASGLVTAKAAGTATITVAAYNGAKYLLPVTVLPAPGSIGLAAERSTIGVNEKLQLNPVFEEGSAACSVSYRSSSSKIATVSNTGLVTGKKAGSATITVTAYNGVKGTFKVTVRKAPSSVKIVADRTVLGAGETVQLGYKLSSGSESKVIFSAPAEAKSTLEVHENGLLNAYTPGQAQVTATTFNNKKHTLTFTVKQAPTAITVDKPALLLGVGMKDQVTAALNEGSAGAIFYRSEHPEIAAVDSATGAVTAVAPGKTRIVSYTYVDGVEAYTDVEIRPEPTAVTLPFTTLKVGLGDKVQLEPQVDEGSISSFKYKSSNTRYATVSADGLVTAKKTGKITITVTTYNNKSCKFTLNIQKAPSGIKLAPAQYMLGVGETVQLNATLTSGTSSTLKYESSNPEIALVDARGIVLGMAEGSATITATTHNGKKATAAITVAPAPQAVHLNMADVLGVGMSAQCTYSFSPSSSHSNPKFEIVSGDALRMDENGVFTAVKEGTATVRVSTHAEGVYADHLVTVKPAPSSISFGTDKISVEMNEEVLLSPVLSEGSYTNLSYKIKKAGIFEIGENGLIMPIQRGSSDVVVTTHNGLSATITVWIVDRFYPEAMELAQTPPTYLEKGHSYQPKVSIFPDTAIANLVWSSSAPQVISIDETTGEMKALSSGVATIKVVSTRNPSLTASFKVIVPSQGRCLVMPAETTSISGIDANLQKIRNVRESAYHELQDLLFSGVISQSNYSARKAIIDRGFEMYLFPWMTKTKELYWKAANSEGGMKDFKPGTVYYGMAYTQTSRTWHPDKLVSNGYYTSSGNGYYLMNGSKFSDRKYPGSDCSSFASMATWGLDHSRASNNTSAIATASYYTTLSDWTDLRPGDLINKAYKHVVMFLYYTDATKEKMVILEQGGGSQYSNTISVSIRNVSKYQNDGYKIRRASSIK